MKNKILLITIAFMTLFSISGLAQKNKKAKKQSKVLISTNYGDIKLVLYNETPQHRDNFIKLIKEGFYDSLLFHRVMQNFMIQGGDPESKNAAPKAMLGNGGPGYTIPAEFDTNFTHKKGALAAARQPDQVNPNKESSGSQFYIVQGKKFTRSELEKMSKRSGINYSEEQYKTYETEGGYAPLDGSYTVFGEVIEGFDVLDKIAAVATNRANRPKEDVTMTIKIVKR
jgi:peptidyl-prolyl cis-trans isomerase B (cyclophilin B)